MTIEGHPQIVITGIGLVTCLGLSARDAWEGVQTRRRAMGPMPALESPLPIGRTGGQAPELPASFMPNEPREVRYLRWAINAAIANLDLSAHLPHRIGVVLGTTLHGIRQGGTYLRTGDAAPMQQFLGAAIMRDALKGLPINGPAITTCSACSSGLGAIALGMTLLRTNQVDLVIAGGYDPVSEYVYAGFDSLRLVAESDARPFAKGRDGMKIAEGYAVVAIEREADAQAQSRKPLASLLGYGETSDSHHLTQPHPGGEGAARAARAALTSAGLPPQAIGLVAAHATSTPNNDAAEFAGLTLAFGDRTKDLPVVAFKSHVGHTLGGAGATELILSLLALRDQTFPPTANTAKDDLEFPVRANLDTPRLIDIAATMNLSLGFGGSNAAMILGRHPAPSKEQDPPPLRPVLITGVGVVAPNAIGNEAFLHQLADPAPASSAHLDDSQISHLLNARRVRRMSEYVKATLAATTVACQNASITDIPAFAADAAAVLGTCLGSSSFCESYYRPITKDGLAAANPALFAEGVPNAGAAQLSLMFQVKGPCQTIIGSRTAGVEALYLAALRIASGEWERAIVSAGEEFHETAVEIYKALGLYSGSPPTPRAPRGMTLSTGAVTFILESESSAQSRAAQSYAAIDPTKSGAIRADSPAALARMGASLLSRLGAPRHLITSANGTWLDRIEAATIRSLPRVIAASVDGLLPDLASANSLAGLAATLLTGRIPGSTHPEAVAEVGVLATDYAGLASCIGIKMLGGGPGGRGHP